MADVTAAPVRGGEVNAQFDGGADTPLASVRDGIHELLVPPGTTRIRVTAPPPEPWWTAMQDVVVDTSPSTPRIRVLTPKLIAIAHPGRLHR
jgi:hypothetical protein